MIVTTACFALIYTAAAVGSSASSSVPASSFLRRSSSTTKNSNTRRTLVGEETEETTAAAPCQIQVDFGACPLPPPLTIENGCANPFQRITFRYTDSTCAQSAHFVHRHDGTTCTDYDTANAADDTIPTDNQMVVDRSVPTKRLRSNRLGSSSSASSSSLLLSHTNAYPAEESIEAAATKYITVTSQNGDETYFTGTVGLGEEYTINENADYAVLRDALTITVYENNNDLGSIVQQTNVVLDCSTNPVFLLDTFGAHQITAWTEITGRTVALPTHSIQTATIPITITNPFSSSSSSTSSSSTQLVAMSVISNMDDAEHPMEDYTSEIQNIRLQPGQSMTPREYVFEYQPSSGPRTRYTFLTTVIGTNPNSNQQCHASATIECIL